MIGGSACDNAREDYAFYAQFTTNDYVPSLHEVIKFDRIITNVGVGYNPSTGKFTAEERGVYFFQLKMTNKYHSSNHMLHLHIMKNSGQVGFLSLNNNKETFLTKVNSVVIQLDPGDTVYVKVTYLSGTNKIGGQISPHSSKTEFMGYRI